MSLILNVPYSEKDEAKKLGARYNPESKEWYVENRKDYRKFIKWIVGNEEEVYILCDYFFILIGNQKCFKCGHETTVIGFGFQNHYVVSDPDTYGISEGDAIEFCNDEIYITSFLNPFPDSDILKFLKEKFDFYESYSKIANETYLANHCNNCGVIQGQYYLFNEGNSPFAIGTSKYKAENISLYRVLIPNDIIVKASNCMSATTENIYKNSNIYLL